ncbi:MAG TPA: AAA family ATPase [Xanthobacteraceae bacterium]|jgi:adenylate kinase|nr:AAA family ATPase [Xanthobacteraceae bacterium]
MRRVVALTGLSGVGKSTLIKTLSASISLEHLQASALIKDVRHAEGDASITQDELRLVDIDENQKLLIRGFRLKTGASKGLILLDGHTIIEQDDGLSRIDPRVFGAIGIDSMIFLVDDPEAIGERRRNDPVRKRPVPSADNLRLIQVEAQDHATSICRALSIPLYTFRPDQAGLISQALRR